MKKKSILKALMEYLPDRSVLDRRESFDDDLSAALFHKGGEIGCIVLHGIGGTPANVRVVADALVKQGCTVLSPVLPGHRETVRALNASTGEEWLSSIRNAYARLKSEGCTRIFALGLSLGGILCGLLATEVPLDGLVLICAPIEMQPFLHFARRISLFIPFVRYPNEKAAPASSQHTNPYAQMYDGFSTKKLVDLNRLCRRLRISLGAIRCPTLMINAKFDDKVAPESTEIWKAGAIHAPTVHVFLENSPHGCTYARERMLVAAKCAAFVASTAAGCSPEGIAAAVDKAAAPQV